MQLRRVEECKREEAKNREGEGTLNDIKTENGNETTITGRERERGRKERREVNAEHITSQYAGGEAI